MRRLVLLVVLLVSALLSVRAHAESIDAEAATLGARTERAELVVRAGWVATERGDDGLRRVQFHVLEVLRGAHAADVPLVVEHTVTASGEPWRAHRDHLLFLRRASEGAPWQAVAGTLGLVTLADRGPDAAPVPFVRAYAAALDDAGRVVEPDDLRRLLAEGCSARDDGLAASCATDLVRRRELLDGLTETQRTNITASFGAAGRGPAARAALAPLLAAAACPGAEQAFVDAASRADGRPLRQPLGEALARVGDGGTPGRLAARLAGASDDAVVRENLLHALGSLAATSGAAAAVPVVTRGLRDRTPAVRAQAAHALGRLARTLRAAEPDARLGEHAAAAALLTRAATPNERRAAAWCLAQFDTPDAFALLRRFATSDPRDDVRRIASRYLERPRLRLVLR